MLKLQVKGIRNESRSLNRVIIREVLSDRVTSEQRPEEEKSKPCGYGGEREIIPREETRDPRAEAQSAH